MKSRSTPIILCGIEENPSQLQSERMHLLCLSTAPDLRSWRTEVCRCTCSSFVFFALRPLCGAAAQRFAGVHVRLLYFSTCARSAELPHRGLPVYMFVFCIFRPAPALRSCRTEVCRCTCSSFVFFDLRPLCGAAA